MDILLIIVLILMIIGVVLIFKFVKKLFVAALLSVFLVMVIIGLVGLFTYLDAMSIQKNKTEQNLLVFHTDDRILLAASFPFEQDDASMEERIIMVDSATLTYEELIDNSNPIQKTYYKIFLINASVSEDLFADEVEFTLPGIDASVNITKEEALYVLESEDALTSALDVIGDRTVSSGQVSKEEVDFLKEQVRDELAAEGIDSERMRMVIGGLFVMKNTQNDPANMIKQILSNYHSNEIKVYEKTMIFRLLDMAPSSILEGVIEGVTDSIPRDGE